MSFNDFTAFIISKGLSFSLHSGKTLFRNVLRNRFWHSFVRSLIKLSLVYAAILIVVFSPFGGWKSELVASLVFIAVALWSLVNGIVKLKDIAALIVRIIKERSLSEGIIQFVEDKWLGARVGIKLYDALRNGRGEFAGHFNHLPSSRDVVKDYAAYVLKDVVLFGIIFGLYFLIMNFGVKNLLLEKYAGLSSFEVYAFPFVQLLNFFKRK
ncbi:MAG: hypothetical protein VZR56_08505 [Treponema sp.]|nr:hypothetical protein [Treponema sp.]